MKMYELPDIERPTAPMEEIHRVLRQRILNEDYSLGSKLSENAIAREFGCSRTPVREAFKRLENEGLIEIRPQSGTYVRMITTRDYIDLLEVRAYIEGLAFRLATEVAPAEAIESLLPLLQEMDRIAISGHEGMQRYAELHYQFHFAIVRMSGNGLLATMFERLNLRSSHMFLRSMTPQDAKRTQDEHYRIFESLRVRDAKGEKFMIGHLWKKKLSYSRR
jgi:DNA-binding GntR family transcriptional regulator